MVALVGQDPDGGDPACWSRRRFGSSAAWGYTLYYATTFVFTGLAVAVAFHGGLFNIGGEGQGHLGGLGTGLVALWLSRSAAWIMLPLAMLLAARCSAGLGGYPGLPAGLPRQPS